MTWVLLLSLLVKSSLVAGAGLTCAHFLAQRPVDRVDILRATVCLLLALPVIMNALPAMNLALLPAAAPELAPAVQTALQGGASPMDAPTTVTWPPSVQLIGGLWLLGVAAILGQLLLGLHTLARWTRRGDTIHCPAWTTPLDDLSPADRPHLVSSDRLTSPLSWGVTPGFIVVDPASLAERHAAQAILAHELAHLRRHDWIFLILSRLALAMFWFNPLVWRLHAVLAERSEEAADANALQTVDRALYARALVRLAAHPTPRLAATPLTGKGLAAPRVATGMAADARTLKTRIACIMTDTSARRRPLTVALTVAALAAVATPLAALGVSRQTWVAPAAPPAPPIPAMVAPPPPVPPEPVETVPTEPVEPVPPAPPAAPPAPPEPPEAARYGYSYFRVATEADKQAAAQARAQAESARAQADEARRQADQNRAQADQARAQADQARAQADIARVAANAARRQADQARIQAEQARLIGERARQDAAQHMIKARVEMAKGAVQMHESANDLRAEAIRLRDPSYRAMQIANNRAQGNIVTDAELRAAGSRMPAQADELDRQADRLAEEARKTS